VDPKRLEGVIPKHAVCAHCGYQFGGAAIIDGRIRCPECGKLTDFVAPLLATGQTSEPRPLGRSLLRMTLLLILAAVVAAVLAARLG